MKALYLLFLLAVVALAREYRSLNNYGNNANSPTQGMTGTSYKREYAPGNAGFNNADGNTIRLSVDGGALPNARLISNTIFGRARKYSDRPVSDMHTYFGQLVSLDISSLQFSPGAAIIIPVPTGDAVFDPTSSGNASFSFTRWGKKAGTGTPTVPPQHLNSATGHLDLSPLYGDGNATNFAFDTEARAVNNIRTFTGGQINVAKLYDGVPARVPDQGKWRWSGTQIQMNKTPALATWFYVFAKEHNRLADIYAAANPDATDEIIFEEARRINIAQYQKIVTREYIATLTGEPLPPYVAYNSSVNAQSDYVFSHAAFRYAHTEINEENWMLDESGNVMSGGHLPLRDTMFRPQTFLFDPAPSLGYEPLLRGLATQPQGDVQGAMTYALRNMNIFGTLFHQAPQGSNAPSISRQPLTDLAMVNIMRGRDFGLPTLNNMRRILGFTPYSDFNISTTDTAANLLLQSVYNNKIEDVDLFVGGVLEDKFPTLESSLGETFRTIIRQNFVDKRDGDRFWYENRDQFTDDEVFSIYNTTLGDIIVRNTGIDALNQNVFFTSAKSLPLFGGTALSADTIDLTYDHTVQLHTVYILSWSVVDDYIKFRIRVRAEGWVGLGFSPKANTMKDADIVLSRLNDDGSPDIKDCYAQDVGIPTPDTDLGGTNDILDPAITLDPVAGVQTITFRRKIQTGDSVLDKKFISNQQVIFAFHPTQRAYAYHGPLRSPDQYIDWYASKPGPESDSSGLRIAIQVILAIVTAAVIGFFVILIINRNHARIRYASYIFLILIIFGTLMSFASVLVSTFDQTTELCQLKFGLMSGAFVLVYGSIMAKTWRIHRIFNGAATALEKVSIPNSTLLAYLGVVAIADYLIFAIWNGVTPMTLRSTTSTGSSTTTVSVCESDNDIGLAIFLAFKALVLLYGCYLSVVIRNIDNRFNESIGLSMSIYVTFTIGIVVILLGFFLRHFPNAPLVVHAVGMVFPFGFTVCAQFIPKIYAIYGSAEFTTASIAKSKVSHSGGSNKSSGIAMSKVSTDSTTHTTTAHHDSPTVPKSEIEEQHKV